MYTTNTKVKAYVDVGSMSDNEVDALIVSVSAEMDRMANRKLVAELASGEDSETKYYDGEGELKILIDDCQHIDKLYIGDQYGENFVQNSSFITYPAVAPFRAVIFKNGFYVPCGSQNLKIEGVFGMFDEGEVPADLDFACVVLVAGIILGRNAGGEVSSERIGNYSVSYDTTAGGQDYKRALDIISGYRKNLF
jgi:hypothetical protein